MADEKPKQSCLFHYIKGPYFETRRAEGVIVDETPASAISLTFFVGRNPLPKLAELEILEDGSFGDVLKTEIKEGVVFELQQGILLDADEARKLRDRLTEVLSEIEP